MIVLELEGTVVVDAETLVAELELVVCEENIAEIYVVLASVIVVYGIGCHEYVDPHSVTVALELVFVYALLDIVLLCDGE